MSIRNIQIAAMWVFLGPLIVILGTVDILTKGRSRNWPLGEQPQEDHPPDPEK